MMFIMNVPKMALYLGLIVLAVLGEVAWWLPLAVIAYDATWIIQWKSKRYKALEKAAEAEMAQVLAAMTQAGPPPGTPDQTKWN